MSKKMDKQCVMLAAGLSSRMGKWKMMMPWGEGTILDSALASALAFCDRVVLVTGFRGDELAACYRDHPGVEVVFNPQYQDGMFSSIQCGVGHIRASRFFLALGDMPEVTPGVYRRLWANADAGSCIIPAYDRGSAPAGDFSDSSRAARGHPAGRYRSDGGARYPRGESGDSLGC